MNLVKKIIFLLVVLVLAYGCKKAMVSVAETQQGQRIVVISLDTLRHDALFGKSAVMSKTQALAQKGTIFKKYYTASTNTVPAHASMFTGMYPWEHGVGNNLSSLNNRFSTLAEILSDKGFATSAVVAMSVLGENSGMAQGFDRYNVLPMQKNYDSRGGEKDIKKTYKLGLDVVNAAVREVNANKAKKQFYWFHFADMHDPYGDTATDTGVLFKNVFKNTVKGGADKSVLGALLLSAHRAYNVDAQNMDKSVAHLISSLMQDTQFETHIVVVSDHGESFGQDGFVGHGTGLNEDQVRVPLFVISPLFEKGERNDVVGSVDILPTILGIAGVHFNSATYAGRDLVFIKENVVVGGMLPTRYNYSLDFNSSGDVFTIPKVSFYITDGIKKKINKDDENKDSYFASLEQMFNKNKASGVMSQKELVALRSLGYTH